MKRLQFEVTDEQANKIEELIKLTGVSTKKDLINEALTILQWATRQVANGRIVGSIDVDNDNYRELNTPALEHAAHYSK